MQTRGALFDSRSAAMKAVEALQKYGVDDKRIDLLMPGASPSEFEEKAAVLHEGTGPGAWSAVGAGIGSFAGAAFVTALVPGLGAILGIGAMAAAFIAGGLGGKLAGDAIEHSNLHDDLRDDTHFLYDALRMEKAVLIVSIDDKTDPESVASILRASGGETFDEAREGWWRKRRDEEARWYESQGHGDFGRAETAYRRGFQAAYDPAFSGRSFESVAVKLRTRFTDFDETDFRRGYERAQELIWRSQADASSPASSQTVARASRPGGAVVVDRYSSPSHPGR
jgi:hypothetical protein